MLKNKIFFSIILEILSVYKFVYTKLSKNILFKDYLDFLIIPYKTDILYYEVDSLLKIITM